MGIQEWSDSITLVNLAKEPQLGEELEAVMEMVTKGKVRDVVIDFAEVDIITSSSIAKFLKLRKILMECGCRLVFSSVNARTKNIFTLIGLEDSFEFVQDQFVALAGLQLVS